MADLLSDDSLKAFLSGFAPSAAELAAPARRLTLDIFPDAIETAEGKEIGYGFDRGCLALAEKRSAFASKE